MRHVRFIILVVPVKNVIEDSRKLGGLPYSYALIEDGVFPQFLQQHTHPYLSRIMYGVLNK
jgi:hypothetical protein